MDFHPHPEIPSGSSGGRNDLFLSGISVLTPGGQEYTTVASLGPCKSNILPRPVATAIHSSFLGLESLDSLPPKTALSDTGPDPKPETAGLDSSFIHWRKSHGPVSKGVYEGI
jgi:hypothetical protein